MCVTGPTSATEKMKELAPGCTTSQAEREDQISCISLISGFLSTLQGTLNPGPEFPRKAQILFYVFHMSSV